MPIFVKPPNLQKDTHDSVFVENASQSLKKFLRKNVKSKKSKSSKSPAGKSDALPDKQIEAQAANALTEDQMKEQRKVETTKKVIAFVNASVSAALPGLASYMLSWHLRRTDTKRKIHVDDTKLYECLLAKYAVDKQWSKASQLLMKMDEAQAPLTPQIYMIILDCLGRLRASDDNAKLIDMYIRSAQKVVGVMNTDNECAKYHSIYHLIRIEHIRRRHNGECGIHSRSTEDCVGCDSTSAAELSP